MTSAEKVGKFFAFGHVVGKLFSVTTSVLFPMNIVGFPLAWAYINIAHVTFVCTVSRTYALTQSVSRSPTFGEALVINLRVVCYPPVRSAL